MTKSTSEWLHQPVAALDIDAQQAALARQQVLTKPPGALGRLEDIVIHLAGMQGSERPSADRVYIAIFAGDHGIAAENVSAFPQKVTSEMIQNFARGGAAISVLARTINATLDLINLGTAYDTGLLDNVRNIALGPGTANFVYQPAMTEYQMNQALQAGYETVNRAKQSRAQIFIGGEMGIANSTAASALACILLNTPPAQLTGPGSGLDAKGIAHKLHTIQRALELHRPSIAHPMEALRRLGGFEIAALTGAYIRCAQAGLPVIIDGFIASVAALTAVQLQPDIKNWLLFAHHSTEPGHHHVLHAINTKPWLDLGLHLGEGSGAAVLIPILRLACTLHKDMATFAEAQISGKI